MKHRVTYITTATTDTEKYFLHSPKNISLDTKIFHAPSLTIDTLIQK